MSLADNPTQPFLQIQFKKMGFDFRKFKRYVLVNVSFIVFVDGMPKVKSEDMKFYKKSMFDFQLPTPAYLALARTTLSDKVPISLKKNKS